MMALQHQWGICLGCGAQAAASLEWGKTEDNNNLRGGSRAGDPGPGRCTPSGIGPSPCYLPVSQTPDTGDPAERCTVARHPCSSRLQYVCASYSGVTLRVPSLGSMSSPDGPPISTSTSSAATRPFPTLADSDGKPSALQTPHRTRVAVSIVLAFSSCANSADAPVSSCSRRPLMRLPRPAEVLPRVILLGVALHNAVGLLPRDFLLYHRLQQADERIGAFLARRSTERDRQRLPSLQAHAQIFRRVWPADQVGSEDNGQVARGHARGVLVC